MKRENSGKRGLKQIKNKTNLIMLGIYFDKWDPFAYNFIT